MLACFLNHEFLSFNKILMYIYIDKYTHVVVVT